MSDQEMQYADPEWHPPQEHATSSVRYEPREPSSPLDDREFTMPVLDSEKLIAPPEHHLKRRTFLSGLLVAGIGLASGLGWLLTRQTPDLPALSQARPAQKRLSANHFTVPIGGVQPRVIVNNIAGDVNVTGAPIDEVVFQTRDQLYSPAPEALSNVTYELSPNEDTITINVDYIRSDESLKNIVLNLQVPSNAALEIHTPYGIYVTGVSGQMVLTTTRDDAGVNVYGDLSGNSILHAVNSIFFYGSLDPHGTYYFECDNGPVMLYLPPDSSFQLQTQADGSITNAFKSNIVGNPPRAQVTTIAHNGLTAIARRP